MRMFRSTMQSGDFQRDNDHTLPGVESLEPRMARIPNKELFSAGIAAYEKNEGRGSDYFSALKKVQTDWGNSTKMTDGIWVLLNRWHRQFYRYGGPDLKAIANCIGQCIADLNAVRGRAIGTLTVADEPQIDALFKAFLYSTHRTNVRGSNQSPVATAKALHLLAPGFLPLWDDAIAARFGYVMMSSEDYVLFCWDMKDHAAVVQSYVDTSDNQTVLKRIDEFNYAAYTKHWVPEPRPC